MTYKNSQLFVSSWRNIRNSVLDDLRHDDAVFFGKLDQKTGKLVSLFSVRINRLEVEMDMLFSEDNGFENCFFHTLETNFIYKNTYCENFLDDLVFILNNFGFHHLKRWFGLKDMFGETMDFHLDQPFEIKFID